MRQRTKPKRRSSKSILRLPDLDHSKSSVLQSLGSTASKRTYGFAIDDFISWYCSEPRLAFGRTVVLRYRYELESRQLAPATINLRLAAVRRLAYEASDNGLLSPDLAASIRRVKGAKRLGIRLGNWLTPAQGKQLLDAPDRASVKGKRNYAMLAVLLGCGLRRSELIRLNVTHLQQRDEHWAIIDLFGKGAMFARSPCPPGSNWPSTPGSPASVSRRASSSAVSANRATFGVMESARKWFGGSCASTQS